MASVGNGSINRHEARGIVRLKNWESVNFENNTIIVKDSLIEVVGEMIEGSPKTVTSMATIPMLPDVAKVLAAHKEKTRTKQKNMPR